MSTPSHVPVLLDRVVALLAPALDRPGAVLVDGTLGLGGHAGAVLDRCPEARLVGIDDAAMRRATWAIGASLATAAGVMVGVLVQLRPLMGLELLLPYTR